MEFWAGRYSISVTIADWPALARAVTAKFAKGEGFALATLNLDHLHKLGLSSAFRHAYDAQDMITADGNPIVWCSQLGGEPISLLPGADLVVPLARLARESGIKLGLVGSTKESLEGAAASLRQQVPGIDIATKIAPAMGFDPEGDAAKQVLEDLSGAGIGLCFLALGAPKQEILAARGRVLAPEIGFASIGAGLDFLSGNQTRAPEWMRKIALEWLWRLLSNPRRLAARYLVAFHILPGHLWRSWRGH